MTAPSKFVFEVGANDIRSAVWLEALTRHSGNIAHTSAEFGFTRQRGSAFTKQHGLVEEAVKMRRAAGQQRTGRPKIKKTEQR